MAATRDASSAGSFQDQDTRNSFEALPAHDMGQSSTNSDSGSDIFATFQLSSANGNEALSGIKGFSPSKRPHTSDTCSSQNLNTTGYDLSLLQPSSATFTDSLTKQNPAYQSLAPHLDAGFMPSIKITKPAPRGEKRPAPSSDNISGFLEAKYLYNAPGDQVLFAEEHELAKRKKGLNEPLREKVQADVPDPEDMPVLTDDGKKPPFSYASLIAMAILRAPNRRLTLAQIYKWISDTFSYYRATDLGWQNSIRHNLSLNKAFIKHERPKDDPGKGNYWMIEPGQEGNFIKEKAGRRPQSSAGRQAAYQLQISSDINNGIGSSNNEQPPASAIADVQFSSKQTEADNLSSDATLPASDPALLEELEPIMPPPASKGLMSSPFDPLRSSPPIAHTAHSPEGTPLKRRGAASSNLPRSRKRKAASMNDSGYFSSLESSALRPQAANAMERDPKLPRFKRGRAEEEIARIRSSSHDPSPSRPRVSNRQHGSSLLSSSPLRQDSMLLPPLTPAVTFKKPARPPPSISPNTNLRNHRKRINELIGSPAKNLAIDSTGFSPAFNIGEYDQSLLPHPVFNIFQDSPVGKDPYESPIKRSIKRPRVERASTAASVLGDITASSYLKSNIGWNPPALGSPLRQKSPEESPIKFHLDQSPSFTRDMLNEDIFGLDLFADEDSENSGGLDLLGGFQKIGNRAYESPLKKVDSKKSRPALGARSMTNLF